MTIDWQSVYRERQERAYCEQAKVRSAIRCAICQCLLTGGADTYGSHDTPLCLAHHLEVKAAENEGDGNYAAALLRVRGHHLQSSGQMPLYHAVNLPPEWITDKTCIETEITIPESAWTVRGWPVVRCPECGSTRLLADAEDWETETGIPVAGSISVSCVNGWDHVFNAKFVKHRYRQSDWTRVKSKVERLLTTVARERFQSDVERISGIVRSAVPTISTGQLSLLPVSGGTV